jgi:hypothetical protein
VKVRQDVQGAAFEAVFRLVSKAFMRVAPAAIAGVMGCGPAPEVKAPAPVPVPLTTSPGAQPDAPASADAEAAFEEMLQRVSARRGLPVRGEVKLRTLDRAKIGELIRAKAARELPPEVLRHETEALIALGLVPPSYDAVAGMFALIDTSISGFYEPEDKTMYLASDLSPSERDETLAHELVHALQDQHYDLGPLFKHAPDNEERVAAGHALAEGDATSAMFDIAAGDAMKIDEKKFAAKARDSIANLAPEAPSVLRDALVAPYTDGFAFVQGLRRRGGFAQVDAAWRALPSTTEQLLHLDKYDAKEPAIEIAPAPLAALARDAGSEGKGSFSQVYSQVLGEQGLRIVLAAWTDAAEAESAAAGWGGDRYVLAKGEGAAAGEVALGWQLRFDTEADAKEMEAVLSAQAHGDCVLRPDVGPFAWARRKRDVALALGPYSKATGKVKATGTCKEAKGWLASMLAPLKKS